MPKGGIRFPSEEKLHELLKDATENYAKRIHLYHRIAPKTARIYGRDLEQLRAIGNGHWRDGFYRVLSFAHECWATANEIKRLKKLTPSGCAREGFLKALESAEKENNDS